MDILNIYVGLHVCGCAHKLPTCSIWVFGDHLQLFKFITAHLVLFILITHSAKLRLRIQAFSGLHSSFHSLSPSAFITAARLSSCFYIDNEYFSKNYRVTLEMKLNSYYVLNNLV